MLPTTPEQSLLLGGIALLVVLALVVALVAVPVRRRRRTARLAAEVDRAEQAITEPAAWREPEPTRTVADAVQRALAVRGARGADVRDRLLAVLLDDPVRAVGATVELDACRRQLERLTGAVEHERTALRGVLARLGTAGLSDEQLARLAGLSVDEVRAVLARDALQPR